MTQNELKGQLIADPANAAIGYIVQNNGEAVADRLRALGFIVNGPKGIEDALNALLQANRTREFVQVLDVPFNTEDADPNEIAAVRDAVVALNARAGNRAPVDVSALFGGLATGTLFYLNSTGQQTVGAKPPSDTGGNKPPEPKKDNTMLYVAIGGGLLLLAAIIIILIKRNS